MITLPPSPGRDTEADRLRGRTNTPATEIEKPQRARGEEEERNNSERWVKSTSREREEAEGEERGR